jgi:aspartate kinase
MFRALAEAGINISAITTSQIKVSVLVQREKAIEALRAVHREFELEKSPRGRAAFGDAITAAKAADAVDVISRLQSMEDLTIHNVALDTSQARVTLSEVPDRPGIAADVFEAVASKEILVDLIVQSVGEDGKATLSFTVPRKDLDQAGKVAKEIVGKFGGGVATQAEIAILSVTGVGIRSHTGVGIRMFQALTDAGINVDMINTSEVRVNVVVDANKGEKGLAALKAAFADVLG